MSSISNVDDVLKSVKSVSQSLNKGRNNFSFHPTAPQLPAPPSSFSYSNYQPPKDFYPAGVRSDRSSVPTDFERKPWGPFKVLDILNRGQYMVLNPIRHLTDDKPDTPGTILKSVWDGFRGKERSQTTDVLGNLGWNPTSMSGKVTRGLVGFAGDILLDPVTYIPFANLTKLGKLASAGKALKFANNSALGKALSYAGKVIDVGDVANIDKIASATRTLLKKAGKADDFIDPIVKGFDTFKGVYKGSDLAGDIASYLAKNGLDGAHAVKYMPTWSKQFKAGQRALFQLEAPRIFGGASTALPFFGRSAEGAVFDFLSKTNSKIRAGRILTNPAIKKLPSVTDDMMSAAKNENLLKLGGEFYDLSKPAQKELAKSNLALKFSAAITDSNRRAIEAAKASVDSILSDPSRSFKLAHDVAEKAQKVGIDAYHVGRASMETKKAATDLIASSPKLSKLWRGVGSTANTLANTFNFIATPVKKIRRFASGTADFDENAALAAIEKHVGKDAMNLLKKGLADTSDPAELYKRLEVFEVLGNANIDFELERLIKIANREHKPVTIGTIGRSLNAFSPRSGAKNVVKKYWDQTRKTLTALRAKLADHSLDSVTRSNYLKEIRRLENMARPVETLDPSLISRVADTLSSWGNADDILRLRSAFKEAESHLIKMGLVDKATAHNRLLQEGLGYIPRSLSQPDSLDFLKEGGRLAAADPRLSTHGQTIFEASQGILNSQQQKHLLRNLNKTFKYDPHGNPIYGKDLGSLEARALRRKADDLRSASVRAYADYHSAYDAWRRFEAYDHLPSIPPSVRPQYEAAKAALNSASSRYASARDAYISAKNLADEAFLKRDKVLFNPDVQKSLASVINSARKKEQKRLTFGGIVSFGKKIGEDGKAPEGFIRATDAFSPDLFKELDRAGVGSADIAKALKETAIPVEYVAPLNDMLRMSDAKKNALVWGYEQCLKQLRPLMLAKPTTQLRNFISSISMAWAAGDLTPSGIANFGKTFKYSLYNLAGHPEKMADVMVNIRGKNYAIRELFDCFTQFGGVNSTRHLAEFANGGVSKLEKNLTTTRDVLSLYNSKTSQFVEDAFRFNHFLNRIQKGDSVADAVESCAKFFYDYNDLSKFESNVLRNVFPFYTFYRKNMEANARYILSNLGYALAPLKAAHNINAISDHSPGAYPLEWLNNSWDEWKARRGAVRLPGSNKLFLMEVYFPQTAIASFNPFNAFSDLSDMVSPALKMPIELFSNHDFYTGRPIKSEERPSQVFGLLPMHPYIPHILRPVRLLDVIDKGAMNAFPNWYSSNGTYVRPDVLNGSLSHRTSNFLKDAFGVQTYYKPPEKIQHNMLKDLKHQKAILEKELENDSLIPILRSSKQSKLDSLNSRIQEIESYDFR